MAQVTTKKEHNFMMTTTRWVENVSHRITTSSWKISSHRYYFIVHYRNHITYILYNDMSKSYLLLTCLIIISSSYSVGQPPLLIIISASSSKTASTTITKKSIHKGKECIISLSFDFVIFMSSACLVTFYSLELDEMHCVFWYIISIVSSSCTDDSNKLVKGLLSSLLL